MGRWRYSDEARKAIQQEVERLRAEGLTQIEASKKVGISVMALWRWEVEAREGKRPPKVKQGKLKVEHLNRLRVLLRLSPADWGMVGEKWRAKQARQLVKEQLGISISISTANKLLLDLGIRSKVDIDLWKVKRLRALSKYEEGKKPKEIAREVDVALGTVCKWIERFGKKKEGIDG